MVDRLSIVAYYGTFLSWQMAHLSVSMSELKLPQVLCVGPQRAGTSWLDQYLRSRGDFCLPKVTKETFFFDQCYDRGLKHYAGFFDCPTDQPRVEVAPTYFDDEPALVRIRRDLGAPKLIVTLRHPAERSHSLYLHHIRTGRVTGSLPKAIAARPRILTSSYYAEHLQRWVNTFGRENILVLFYEDLAADGQRWASALSRFLDMPDRPVPEALRHTKVGPSRRPYVQLFATVGHAAINQLRQWKFYRLLRFGRGLGLKRVIDGRPVESREILAPDDRRFLLEALRPQVEALEKMLGREFAAWKV